MSVTRGKQNRHESNFVCDDDIKSSPYVLSKDLCEEMSPNSNNGYFEDPDFPPDRTSIQGSYSKIRNCRCNHVPTLSFINKPGSPNHQKPYYHCTRRKCNFFAYAYTAEQMPWFRFGLIRNKLGIQDEFKLVDKKRGFQASDLLQGKVGDCWFLSALAVIAQREDLIQRLFPEQNSFLINLNGKVEVRLFIDGWWRSVIIDNFLPCIIDKQQRQRNVSKKQLPNISILSHTNISAMHRAQELLQHKHGQKYGCINPLYNQSLSQLQNNLLQIQPTSQILAYSKTKYNQLWVPFLEKAYAKSHGCYQSISGGQISEAFLDLTGCPTLTFGLQNEKFEGIWFWLKLKYFCKQGLPMGCATAGGRQLNEVGLVGHHAYSILDVREFKISPNTNSWTMNSRSEIGNVSGFGNDGYLRLLKIRNPHGKGEWNGDWSDKSQKWQTLLRPSISSECSSLSQHDLCSMQNDGMFWMDYDHFLMGFHLVDVCLAFPNLHAKSFLTSFPPKQNPFRCQKAYEVSIPDYAIIDMEDDNENKYDENRSIIEVYVMAIQKTRRGISSGKTDKKVSYKLCDSGFLIIYPDGRVDGILFGMQKNGHFHFLLNKAKKQSSTAIIVPISFGHPSATDKELSFTVRFIGSGPLKVKPLEEVPPLQNSIQKFCFNVLRSQVILDCYPLFRVFLCERMGGTVFVYLMVSDDHTENQSSLSLCIQVVANVRGMTCRSSDGLENHKVISKGKKFEAAWRQFTKKFENEKKSRLLLAFVQSGYTWEVGVISCERIKKDSISNKNKLFKDEAIKQASLDPYFRPLIVDNDASSMIGVSDSSSRNRGIFETVYPNQVSEMVLTKKQIQSNSLDHASSVKGIQKQKLVLDLLHQENVESAMRASRMEYKQLEEDQIAKALDESLKARKDDPISVDDPDIVNFEATFNIDLTKMGNDATTKTPNEDISSDGRKIGSDQNPISLIDNEKNFIDLLSSDEECNVLYDRRNTSVKNNKKINTEKNDNNMKDSIEKKRKKAFEAAQSRFKFKNG